MEREDPVFRRRELEDELVRLQEFEAEKSLEISLDESTTGPLNLTRLNEFFSKTKVLIGSAEIHKNSLFPRADNSSTLIRTNSMIMQQN